MRYLLRRHLSTIAEGALESSSPIADWMLENTCSAHH
jgi:hypothetical protein